MVFFFEKKGKLESVDRAKSMEVRKCMHSIVHFSFPIVSCLAPSLRGVPHPPPASPAPLFLAFFFLVTCIPETGFGLSVAFNFSGFSRRCSPALCQCNSMPQCMRLVYGYSLFHCQAHVHNHEANK